MAAPIFLNLPARLSAFIDANSLGAGLVICCLGHGPVSGCWTVIVKSTFQESQVLSSVNSRTLVTPPAPASLAIDPEMLRSWYPNHAVGIASTVRYLCTCAASF